MMTEIVECAHDDLRIGMGLTVSFRGGGGAAEDGEAVAVFRPRG